MTDAKSVSVMDADKIDRSLTRIAHEIVERHRDVGRLVLVGIRTRGVPLARRLQGKVRAIEGKELPLGILDINLYRDDITSVGPSAILKETIIHFPIDERRVILVDDVLFTGRTVRAALDGLMDFGRPKSIELAVLVDIFRRQVAVIIQNWFLLRIFVIETASGFGAQKKVLVKKAHQNLIIALRFEVFMSGQSRATLMNPKISLQPARKAKLRILQFHWTGRIKNAPLEDFLAEGAL